jgi:hypothetical protein
VLEMLTDPGTLLGLSDGGAHCGAIVDASVPSFMLSHWGRDRRGPGLPLPLLVKMQTGETADFFGFGDRGRLKPGRTPVPAPGAWCVPEGSPLVRSRRGRALASRPFSATAPPTAPESRLSAADPADPAHLQLAQLRPG